MMLQVRLLSLLLVLALGGSVAAEPLRVFLRAGAKTHGPNQHDHPRFLEDWTRLLGARGARVDGGLEFPTAAQLGATDVLVIYAADGMNITGPERERFEAFLRRGGGLVVIHDGVVSGSEHEWAKQVQGGAWRWDGERPTRWHEGEVGIYFVDLEHPITRGLSNFDWQDEIYYDLDMAAEVRVLATSFHSVFVIAPQLWTYERTWPGGVTPYRAFVSLPGHEHDVFDTNHYRVLLLRGIAWAGKRLDVDEFCRPEEIAERALKYPVGGPTAPEEAAGTIELHPDFELRLVASEPLIEKVISLDWSPDGRLWVAETPEYPHGRTVHRHDAPIYPHRDSVAPRNGKEDRPARDRISWLEDTSGDGRMDRKQVFYEGLELVTSLVFHRDGVIVQQAPDILWLRDTTGDGRADRVEKLYTGFGTFDSHAVINNMRWGLDGWIYSAIGYSAGAPASSDGSRQFGPVTAGILRFRPDGTALEQVASGACNTWGFDQAPDGELFYTTATCGEHLLHVVMPEKALARGNVGRVRASAVLPDHQHVAPLVRHTRPAYLQIDWVGMFTAAAGSCIYHGGAWPEPWDRMHFLHEPTVSLVHNDLLLPRGVTYAAIKEPGREQTEFMASTDLWFRPIHARVGPDGALYVVDWYNQAAIHNDTRGPAHGARNAATRPDRDHHFARIWRVQHREAEPDPRQRLAADDPVAWLDALSSRSGWLRQTAHRLLSERAGPTEIRVLEQLLEDTSRSTFSRLHALWLLEHWNRLGIERLTAAIQDHDPILRRNALRAAAERDLTGAQPDLAMVRARIRDPDPRARLWALIALQGCDPTPAIAAALVDAWPTYDDPHTQSAAVAVTAREPFLFLDAMFQASAPDRLIGLVAHTVRVLANRQDPTLAALLVQRIAAQPSAADALKQAALEALSTTLQPELTPPWNVELRNAVAALLRSSRFEVTAAVLPLITRWDHAGSLRDALGPAIAPLLARLTDETLADADRARAALNLLGVRTFDPSILPAVARLVTSGASMELRQACITALGRTGDLNAAQHLIDVWPGVPLELQEAIFGELIQRPDWALALLDRLAGRRLDLRLLGPTRAHRLRTHPDRRVATQARDIIEALEGPERREKDALIARLGPMVTGPGGDPVHGRRLFIDNCAQCHVFRDEGRELGPNLTGMGAHGPWELLVSILDPNRVVEPNYLSTSIETLDDLVYDGVVASENRAEVVLRNATADYTIRKSNIASRHSTGLSLMPEGYEALGPEALRDLIAFLCADDDQALIPGLGGAIGHDLDPTFAFTPVAPSTASADGPRVLIVGAGDAHDFPRWFLAEDAKILAATGARVRTTDRPDDAQAALHELDVLYLSNNAPFRNPATRRAILDFADRGKGLLLVHAALWHNWPDWPSYNQLLAGGGSRGHDPYGEFEVVVSAPDHPVMHELPRTFSIRDELYWFDPDPQGSPIEVLATAHSTARDATYPVVFIVRHPHARIVGITLGHDGAAHQHPAYIQLLRNSLRWVAGPR